MAKRHPSLRLFVGVYPPREVVAILGEALGRLDLPPHRLTPPGQVHLTLQFIGDTPLKALDELIDTVGNATKGIESFALTPERLIVLPPRGLSRLVAAATDAPPPLLELQRRLAARLARAPRRRPGDRFLPHLTLCRFRDPARIERFGGEVAAESFPVTQVMLMKSTLGPDGATHELVEPVTLEA